MTAQLETQVVNPAISIPDRKAAMLAAVDELLEAQTDWQASDSTLLSKRVEVAVEDLLVVFSTGDVPGELRALTAAAMELAPAWDRWRTVADINHPAPGPDFWGILQKLRLARKDAIEYRPKRLESVKQLRSMNPPVKDEQICRMYGWYSREGRPEYWKIEEEMDEPGKWSYKLYPQQWMPPHEKVRQQQIQAQFEAADRQRRERQARLEAATRAAKESYQELCSQPGITLTQIARMKRVTIDEAAEEIRQLGVPLPPLRMDMNSIASPHDLREPETAALPQELLLDPSLSHESWNGTPERSSAQNGQSPSDVESGDFPADDLAADIANIAADAQSAAASPEDQIRSLAAQGYTNHEIAAIVSIPENPVDIQRVVTVLRGPSSAGGPGLDAAASGGDRRTTDEV